MKNFLSLEYEQLLLRITGFAFLLLIITGLITFILPGLSKPQQIIVLVHIFLAVPLSGFLAYYLIQHTYRTIGHRRFAVLLTGFCILIISSCLIISGWIWLLQGKTESNITIINLHIYSGILLCTFLVLHIITHISSFPLKRKSQSKYLSLALINKNILVKQLGIFVALIAFFIFLTLVSSPELKKTASVKNYEYTYGEHPFRPSQTETYHGAFIDPREIENAQECAHCHKAAYDQWYASAHRQAASDLTYQKNIDLLSHKKGLAATRYCEGCHAPIALLTGMLSSGGQHAGTPGSSAHAEGVNCLSCHAVDKIIHTEGVASYLFGKPSAYLFAHVDMFGFNTLRRTLLKTQPDLHKQNMMNDAVRSPELCASCHSQFMDKDMNHWGLVNLQDEYQAWVDSPFSHRNNKKHSKQQELTCKHCHMPPIKGTDIAHNKQGLINSHLFLGANTLLPLLNKDEEFLEQTIAFLSEDKMRVSINIANRDDAVESLKRVDKNLRQRNENPIYYYLDETVKFNVIVSNIGVGHNFPGGTIDLGEAWIEVKAADVKGNMIFNSGYILEDEQVEKGAYFYKAVPIDKHGKEVWRHDLFNKAGESFKRIIAAGESDIVPYEFKIPISASSPITVLATLKYRKLNPRYAKWALEEDYIKLPIVDMAFDSVSFPIITKPAIKSALDNKNDSDI